METLLLVITIVSAGTAIFALTAARRLQRGERQRSEARVAALSAAADTPRQREGGWTQVAGEWQWAPETRQPEPVIGDRGFGVSRTGATEPVPNPQSRLPELDGGLFSAVQREEPAGARFPVLVAAAAIIVIVGGALIFLNTSSPDNDTAPVAQVAHKAPIELISLGHARDVAALTISGAVRNPSSGSKLEGLTAVVSLLDRDGALVSTKDVPLDYRALRPGEEAPFKISIPNPGAIARYRVSFRAGTEVVPHVDRRSDTKLASAIN